MSGLLGGTYRAAHEPERAETLDMILRESRGEIDGESFRAYLVERSARLDLDYDVAWANQFIVNHLVEVFPDARFVALVRDPYSWIQSIAGHLLSRDIPPAVRRSLDWWFRPEEHPHTAADAGLRARGLYSAAAFFAAWRRHVETCAAVPQDRLLLLRTDELARSHGRLARFLGIPEDTLHRAHGHRNTGTWEDRIESLVDRDHLEETVESICGEHVARLFPGFTPGHEGPIPTDA